MANQKSTYSKQIFLSLILLFNFYLSCKGIAQAQTIQDRKLSSKYSTVPFDTTLSQLPRNYIGHNIVEIFSKLEDKFEKLKVKDEFETKQQYENRKSNDTFKPILGKLSLNDIFCFSVNECLTNYDADNEMLKIVFPFPAEVERQKSDKPRYIRCKEESIDKEPSIGTNAFGASVNVTREEWTYYDIEVSNYSNFDIGDAIDKNNSSYEGFRTYINVKPSIAKKIKSNIKGLIICKLITPYVSRNNHREKATLNFPYQTTYWYMYIHTKVLELWFVDSSTGKVLYKSKGDFN